MVLVHVAMSLDGFIAGPGHDMSWTGGAEYDTSSQLADEAARSTGVVLAGRGWYEVANADEGDVPQVRLKRTYVGTTGTLTDVRFRVAGRR
jgi:dihydrofolate reductase